MAIVVVDGNSILCRVYHASAYSHVKANGKFVGGLAGFLVELRRALSLVPEEITKCTVIWDGGHSARRLAIYEDYKVDDKEDDAQKARLQEQRIFVQKILPFLSVSSITIPGKEADDVIALIAKELADKIYIVSDDSDFKQLVCNNVSIVRLKGTPALYEGALDSSHTLIDKSCTGDKSDKIKGVSQVGEETMRKLFLEFKGTSLIDFVEYLCAKRGQDKKVDLLLDGLHIIFRNYQLVCLGLEEFSEEEKAKCFSFQNYAMPLDYTKLRTMFTNLNFAFVLQDIPFWMRPFTQFAKAVIELPEEN